MSNKNNKIVPDVIDIENSRVSIIQTISQPPNYEILFKPNFVTSSTLHPTQYDQPQPLSQFQPTNPEPKDYRFMYKRYHKINGILSLVFGSIVMFLDPLLPAIFQYYYSIFPAGLFMIISGICSIHGSKKQNECSLKAALTFNILALILLSVSCIMGIIAASNPTISITKCRYTQCMPNINFFVSGIYGLAIFNTIFGFMLFYLVLWDSTVKCRTFCCRRKA